MNNNKKMKGVDNSDNIGENSKLFLKGGGFLFPLVRISNFIGADMGEVEKVKDSVLYSIIQRGDDAGFTSAISQYSYDEAWSVIGGRLDREWNLDVVEQSNVMCQVVVFEDGGDKKVVEKLGFVLGVDLKPTILRGEELMAYEKSNK